MLFNGKIFPLDNMGKNEFLKFFENGTADCSHFLHDQRGLIELQFDTHIDRDIEKDHQKVDLLEQ